MLDLQVTEVIVYGAAYHTDRSVPHNEINPGLGLKLKRPQDSFFYTAGEYKNSEWRNSVYFGVGKEFWKFGPMTFSVMAGGVTGYKMPVMPIVVPEIQLDFGGVGVAIDFIPPTPWSSGVFGFSLFKKF